MFEKTIIPAGGRGDRLRPLTDVRPKPNVYVATKRLLEYVIDRFVAAGYYDITLAVHYRSDDIEKYFSDGSNFIYSGRPLRIRYAKALKSENILGDADAIRKSRPAVADGFVARDTKSNIDVSISPAEYFSSPERYEIKNYIEKFDQIIVSNGDLIHNFDVSALVDHHKRKGAIATVALYDMSASKERIVGNLGCIEIDKEGHIKNFQEKPERLEDINSNLINTGIYVFDRSIFDELDRNQQMHSIGKQVFRYLKSKYTDNLYGLVMKGYWNDVGTIQSYRETHSQLIDGIDGIDIFSRKERAQENSRILGYVNHSLFAQGISVENGAYVEDSVIGNDVHIGRNVKLRNSIILPASVILSSADNLISDRGVLIEEGAVIGKNVVIGAGVTVKAGARIMDNVKIGVGEIIEKGQVIEKDILPEQ